MKRFLLTLLLAALLGVVAPRAGLSLAMTLPGPDLKFAKGTPPVWAAPVLRALHEPETRFIGGYVSYSDPKPYTVLDYNGDTSALNALLGTLASTQGLHVGVSFTRGTAANAPSGSWRVEYTVSLPDRVSVQINLKSHKVNVEKLRLPDYPAGVVAPGPPPERPSSGFPCEP